MVSSWRDSLAPGLEKLASQGSRLPLRSLSSGPETAEPSQYVCLLDEIRPPSSTPASYYYLRKEIHMCRGGAPDCRAPTDIGGLGVVKTFHSNKPATRSRVTPEPLPRRAPRRRLFEVTETTFWPPAHNDPSVTRTNSQFIRHPGSSREFSSQV